MRIGLRNWITCAGGTILLLAGHAESLHAQVTFESLEVRWRTGGDPALLEDLERYWAEMPDGHRWEIQFMAGIERCQRGDLANVTLGRAALRSLTSRYDRTGPGPERLQALAALADQCQVKKSRSTIARSHASREDVHEIAGIAYSNKVFWEGCLAHANGGRRVLRVVSGSSPATFRVYSAADSTTAKPWARDPVQGALSGFNRSDWPFISGHRVGRFLLTSWGRRSRENDLKVVGDSLEFARVFFSREFGLETGDTLFSVYLVPDENAMSEVSQTLHGIRRPESLIGYSVDLDQSIVAIVPGVTHGTAKHELVHLLMHRDYADAPPWMDEGLAALYEVAVRRGDRLVGLPNWRGGVIRAYSNRPALDRLLAMSPAEFNGGSSSDPDIVFGRQSLNHAIARYFLLYLQEQGLLREVVRGMVNEPLFPPLGVDTAVSLRSTTLQRMAAFVRGRASAPVRARINADFAAWLQGVIPQEEPTDCDAQR